MTSKYKHDLLVQMAHTTKLIGQLMQFVFRATYDVGFSIIQN